MLAGGRGGGGALLVYATMTLTIRREMRPIVLVSTHSYNNSNFMLPEWGGGEACLLRPGWNGFFYLRVDYLQTTRRNCVLLDNGRVGWIDFYRERGGFGNNLLATFGGFGGFICGADGHILRSQVFRGWLVVSRYVLNHKFSLNYQNCCQFWNEIGGQGTHLRAGSLSR